jgi:hypothetical protein
MNPIWPSPGVYDDTVVNGVNQSKRLLEALKTGDIELFEQLSMDKVELNPAALMFETAEARDIIWCNLKKILRKQKLQGVLS